MKSERVFLTTKEAKSLFDKRKKSVHTFINTMGMLIGADWEKKDIFKLLKKCKVEIGGEQCRKLSHGLVIWRTEKDLLYVEVDDKKLQAIEDSKEAA